ncbi:MAG: polyprenyl synthetase family protein [Candidatus Omnitrophica bacterium]|nr:polyprenyl synthetase family protein [Candidatus Omnitrophota bacterium]
MIEAIKCRIEKELKNYIRSLEKSYTLKKISPPLFAHIKEFFLRKGKRVRPSLCVMGYLGYVKKPKPGLYSTALSLEFLHDFMLVHDDIIDKSDTRRGKLSMHVLLNRYISGHRGLKFDGEDLTIIIGDIMFALSMGAFLSIREEPKRKEKALKKLIEAAAYTGSGEFIELLSGLKEIDKITKNDIYKIYDLKTARYTFSYPLAIGALLAGANDKEIDKLIRYGLYLGRAFQIQDDILGMFGLEKDTGKSTLTDLREAKKTLLILNAYKNSTLINRKLIKKILRKKRADKTDLRTMRRLILDSGALALAKKEISSSLKKAAKILASTFLLPAYKKTLGEFTRKIINY